MNQRFIVSIRLEEEIFDLLKATSQDQARPLENLVKEYWKEFIRHMFSISSLGDVVPLMEDFGLKKCVVLRQSTLSLLSVN